MHIKYKLYLEMYTYDIFQYVHIMYVFYIHLYMVYMYTYSYIFAYTHVSLIPIEKQLLGFWF